ncbi:hypothetical protein V1283_005273 [Bradyrhizobium sp. AZCC 2262]|uniref:hypothetical protein n=1 Tax=Bradyrhizobium sp. AZCC 2262 TaxID=3117022 RepID=UPI002FF41677
MIQIKMGAQQPPKEFALGWTLLGWATPRTNRHRLWNTSTMKRYLAPFAIATSLFAPVAYANDALEAKVRAYVPVVSLAKVCDLRISDAASGEHRAMYEAVKSDPNANKLAYRVHYQTQTAYIKARDGGQRVAFCKDFIAANSQYAKARFTTVVEGQMSDVSSGVQKAIAHNVCGAPPVKLSKADWKPYALIKKMLQSEQKVAKENAETNGWNVAEETAGSYVSTTGRQGRLCRASRAAPSSWRPITALAETRRRR